MQVQISLFGPFAVRVDGEPALSRHAHKGKEFLALLALRRGREVERLWVAGILWPNSVCALANLRNELADLRRALGSAAVHLRSPTRHTLSLDPRGVEVDVVAFDAAIAHGDVASLERAVAAGQRPLLEDWDEEWVLEERRVRDGAYLDALRKLAARAEEGGDLSATERYLRQAVARDPSREDFHRALMRVQASGGCYAAAVQVYHELREWLHREWNATPDLETEALYREIRAATRHRFADRGTEGRTAATGRLDDSRPVKDPREARPMRRSHLPIPLTRLIGREAETQEVRRLVAASRLLTLTGSGGIGKTRLAVHVAQETVEEYSDGAWFVELAATSDPALLPQQVASVLGVSDTSSRPMMETLGEFLETKQLLLVLDNCEHLLEACAELVGTLLRRCSRVRILATSRQKLGLTGESVWQVAPLSQEEAVRLFAERATQGRRDFTLTEENEATVARICRRLEGIPLAIELAARQIHARTAEEIAAQLDDRFRLLANGDPTAPSRHQTLWATIQWSYDLLSGREQALLRRLSVFAGGLTLEAAEAVCADGGVVGWWGGGMVKTEPATLHPRHPTTSPPHHLSANEVLDLLAALVEKSLVVAEDVEGETRYRMLETVRQYALEKLVQAGEAEGMRDRHGRFFLQLAERAESELREMNSAGWLDRSLWSAPAAMTGELRGQNPASWLDRLEREHDNLRTATRRLIDTAKVQDGLRMAGALHPYWYVRGYWTEGRERLQELIALAEGGTSTPVAAPTLQVAERPPDLLPARAKALAELAVLIDAQGDRVSARALHGESLAIHRQLGDRRGIAASLLNVGVIDARSDDKGARALLEESLALSRELGDRRGIAECLYTMANAAFYHHDLTSARAFQTESLDIRRAIGDRLAVAASLRSLGRMAQDQGENGAARAFFEESLAITRELGHREGIAESLYRLAGMARDMGDYKAARAFYEESLIVLRELGDKRTIAIQLQSLGLATWSAADYDAAQAAFAESLALRGEIGDRRGVAQSCHFLGAMALDEEDYEAARARFAECLAEWRTLQDHAGIADLLEGMGAFLVSNESPSPDAHQVGNCVLQDPDSGKEYRIAKWAVHNPQSAARRVARLCGAAEALREAIHAPSRRLPEVEKTRRSLTRVGLDEKALDAAWAEGRAMTMEEAIAYAFETVGEM